ncbi:O-antigen ligase family protein [bacterium]|nr:O-antigen ligase family protein [bacterium]
MHTNTSNINTGLVAYKLKKWCFPLAMMLLALFIGWLSTQNPKLPVAIACLMLYGLCLILKPSWAFFILLLVDIRFFCWMPQEFLHIPGAFKLRDLCLLSLFIPFLLSVAIDKDSVAERIKSPVNKFFIGLMIFLLIIIFYTVIEFDVRFISSTHIPRKYLFYLAFFILMFLIKDKNDLKFFIKVFFVLASIQALLMIGQFIIGTKFAIMPFLPHPLKIQNLSGLPVPRVYLEGGNSLMHLFFAISFWLYHTHDKKDARKRTYLILLLLLGLGMFLEFYRTKWFRQFIVVFIPFLFAKPKEKKSVLWQVTTYSFIFIILLFFIQAFIFDLIPIFKKIFLHLYNAYQGLINKTGTYAARVHEFNEKIAYFWQKPLFGLGFLHYISASESSKAAIVTNIFIENVDSEITTLLVTMGICGTVVFYSLSICYIIRCIKIILRTVNPFYRGILLGCLGYFVSGVVTFFSFSFLTLTEEILFIATSIALVEKINQFNKLETQQSDPKEELSSA